VEPNRLLILADESANWKIAGLRQLDRLALAINRFAKERSPGGAIDICVFWKPCIPAEQRWLPGSWRLGSCRFVTDLSLFSLPSGLEPVLSTHLFVGRAALADCMIVLQSEHGEASHPDEMQLWEKLDHELENACRKRSLAAKDPVACDYLADRTEIAGCQKRFLRSLGKSQDGLVSRFVNRPISRSISRFLLQFPITPSAWTLSIFPLMLLAFLFLLRGHFVIGLALFQIYSILDGCDGEIARAKYLQSERGRLLDAWCDVAGNLLLMIGLGFGLEGRYQFAFYGWLYALEGSLCALFIGLNELLLHTSETESDAGGNGLNAALYSRHRRLVEHSGILFLGEKAVWWLAQLTKHDVVTLFFLLLAIIGLSQWILHLSIVVTAASLTITSIARINIALGRRRVP
jgi:hypothetical protein